MSPFASKPQSLSIREAGWQELVQVHKTGGTTVPKQGVAMSVGVAIADDGGSRNAGGEGVLVSRRLQVLKREGAGSRWGHVPEDCMRMRIGVDRAKSGLSSDMSAGKGGGYGENSSAGIKVHGA